MSYSRCTRCHKYQFDPETCRCQPFTVKEYPEDSGRILYGVSAEYIVEQLATNRNSEAPVFEDNIFEDPLEIIDKDGVSKKFNCTASISVDYSVREITE